MAERLHYNQASYDANVGRGYDKSQKTPSFGTGLGSERAMGSSQTGIYTEPPSHEDEDDMEDDFGFNSGEEVDKFVRMINKDAIGADPQGFWPRRDRSSLGHSSNFVGFSFNESMATAMSGMVPFSARGLYPNGFAGPPVGSGGSGQAFRTTGNYRRTGTQYGTSRAPTKTLPEEDFEVDTFEDVLSVDDDTRAILKQKVRIMRLLNRLDEIDSENPDSA